MPVYPDLPTLGRTVDDHGSRIVTLESSAQLGNSTIQGGALVVRDDTVPGNIIALLGAFNDAHFGNTTGLVVQTSAGRKLLVVEDAGGIVYPYQQFGWWEAASSTFVVGAAGEFCSSTSASPTWETLWKMQTELVTAVHLKVSVRVVTPAATTAEFRMIGSAAATSNKAVPASTDLTGLAFWQHGLTLSTGPIVWEMQARLTGGAGPVQMGRPTPLTMTDWTPFLVAGGWV